MQARPYVADSRCLKEIPELLSMGVLDNDNFDGKECFNISWGGGGFVEGKTLAIEGGFFKDAFWLDKKGGFGNNAINHLNDQGKFLDLLREFEPPHDIVDSLRDNRCSKIDQGSAITQWDKVVLIAQVPYDHSCWYNGGHMRPMHVVLGEGLDRYREWLWRECEKYNSNLIIKLSPVKDFNNFPEMNVIFYNAAKEFGCQVTDSGLDIINKAEKVVMYNSTVALDCMIRDVEYECHAKGNFVNVPRDYYRKYVNFLAWKYCLPKQPMVSWLSVFTLYEMSDELFPLPTSLSWGESFRRDNVTRTN